MDGFELKRGGRTVAAVVASPEAMPEVMGQLQAAGLEVDQGTDLSEECTVEEHHPCDMKSILGVAEEVGRQGGVDTGSIQRIWDNADAGLGTTDQEAYDAVMAVVEKLPPDMEGSRAALIEALPVYLPGAKPR